MRCIAYTNEQVGKGISPLYSIKVELDGDDMTIELLKKALLNVKNYNEALSAVRDTLLGFTKNEDGIYINGDRFVKTINFE